MLGKKSKSVFIFGLVMVASFLGFIPIDVHATSPPTIDQHKVQNSGTSFPLLTTSFPNEEIVVFTDSETQGTHGACVVPPVPTVSAPGLTFTIRANLLYNCFVSVGEYYQDRVTEWVAFSPNKLTNVLVTTNTIIALLITLSGVYSGNQGGQTDPNLGLPCVSSGTFTSATNLETCNTVSTSNPDDIVLGFAGWQCRTDLHCPTMNAVGSFTALDTVRSGVFFANAEDEYQSFSTTQTNLQTGFFNSTNNPFAGLGAGWAVVGDAFTADASNVVVPCNFFQLQCWWFPVLFMVSFTGALMFVAMVLRAPQKGKSHIFLSGLTFSSLLLVILGAMNIVLPLILIILNIINVLRMRG